MTFGDLYDFVDLARGAQVPRGDEVVQVPWSVDEPEAGIEKLEAEIPSNIELRRPPDFSDVDREHLVDVLDDIIKSEGDARGAAVELMEISERLR